MPTKLIRAIILGSGKSQMIRKRLSTFHQGFELLNIDETFESVQVIKGLKQKIHHTAFDFALYLNISLIFNNVRKMYYKLK